MEKNYPSLDDKYLNTAMTNVKELKELGMIWPKEEEYYTARIGDISRYSISKLEGMKDKIESKNIKEINSTVRNKEGIELIKKYFGLNLQSLANLYLEYIVKENHNLYNFESSIYYQKGKIVETTSLELPKTTSSVQSVLLASGILESLKNRNIKEVNDLWNFGKVVPLFLNLLFSKQLSFDKENKDLYKIFNIYYLWMFDSFSKIYQESLNNRTDTITRYLGNVTMVEQIYPFINGYLNALKLEKLYQRKPKIVLEEIKKVITCKNTTENMLNLLNTHYFNEEKLINNKIKEYKK